MSDFEFVSVLMSIVVGLGITRILSDLASLAEHRANVRLDGLTLVWAMNVLGYLLIYWWVVVNNWRTQATWSFFGFSTLFFYGVVLYFCAALILPRADREPLDLRERFETIRLPFFLLWLTVGFFEVLDSFSKGSAYVLAELGLPYLITMGVTMVLTVGAIWTRDRRFHWAFAIVTLIGNLSWVMYRFSEI